ncbi:phosphatase PAP2 family protein [Ascidiimonas aurantiaca]|uniref:phosphatase PAP2 family protein n=1 Tax=Ascidiimonas aurantiaca TaxID=1685432 RepID=UPI0030EE048D
MIEKILEYDRSLFIYLNQLSGESFDTFWVLVTQITTWIPLFLIFIFLVFRLYPKKEAVFITITVFVALGFTLLFTEAVKEFTSRLRPNNEPALKTLIRVLQTPSDYSFFSGHASNSFSVTMVLFLFLKKKTKYAVLLFIWPVLFSLSRIFVGVHYPIDILTGTIIGTLIGLAFYRLHDKYYNSYKKN